MRNLRVVFGIVFLLFLIINSNAQSKIIYADKEKSFLKYSMHHPMHDFSGINKKVSCVIAYDSIHANVQKVSVSANVADFNSGSDNRDSHVLEVLESIKYPKIKFASNKIEKTNEGLKIMGILTFHGVSKNITLIASQDINGKIMQIKGSFKVSQEEYSIKRETFMMVPVDDNIDVEFLMQFTL